MAPVDEGHTVVCRCADGYAAPGERTQCDENFSASVRLGSRGSMGDMFGSKIKRLAGALALMVVAGLPFTGHAAAPQDAIVGTWLTDDGASKVDVSASKAADGSSVYAGKLTWLKEPMRDGKPLRDANNADAGLRERPVLGIEILSGFKASAAGWSGGTVYSPRAGKSFPADLSIAPDGRLQLKVKAGIMSKTDYWTR